jgi:hypothetical protein
MGMPINGHHVCQMHGGAGRTRRVAMRNMARAKAARVISREKVEPLQNPRGALRLLAAEALRWKDYFTERIQELEQLRYSAGAGEQTRAELVLWERSMDRAQRFCLDLARLNIDARELVQGEQVGAILVDVLRGALRDPGLPDDPRVNGAVARRLRRVGAPPGLGGAPLRVIDVETVT